MQQDSGITSTGLRSASLNGQKKQQGCCQQPTSKSTWRRMRVGAGLAWQRTA